MATMFAKNVGPILFLFGVVSVLLPYPCFLQLAMAISSSSYLSSNYTDQTALLAFQSSLTFDPTKTILGGNWTTKTSFCNWIGVSCSKRRQRVTALDLSFMGLEGTISPHIGNLSFLVLLDLQNNSFIGSLPNEITSLHRLKVLALQHNHLEGDIPPSLHHCQQLETISLAFNNLSGVIPKQLGLLPRLQVLYLGINSLVGGIPPSLGNISTLEKLSLPRNGLVAASFPPSLLNLSSLILLSFSENNISGVLHVDLCDRWPNIQKLSFSWNNLSGPLPPGMDRCRELNILSLSYNKFVGSIPEQLGSLQNLEDLYLGQNMLSGSIPPQIGNSSNLKNLDISINNIVGSIPRSLGQLSSLVYLSVALNSLQGPIPQELFNLSSLQSFLAYANSLSGTFPSNTGVWLPNIQRLYFSSNQITGHITSFFSNLFEVIEIDVYDNSLYGPIPLNLGSLKHLQSLNLGANQLTGEPGVLELRFLSSLFNSTSLEDLVLDGSPLNGMIPDVSGNSSYSSLHLIYALGCQIKGHIPKTIGSFQNLTSLYLSDNNLSGELPSSIFGLKTLQRLYLGYNNISGSMLDELCLMKDLGELSLENNQFIGSIPSCIGNLSRLQKVFLNSNRLTSSVPVNLWNLETLLSLNLSFNMLGGYLPSSTRKSNSIQVIDISHNQITGSIPSIIGDFPSLESLNLSNNLLIGSVPQGFGDLRGLESLDLSSNNLIGSTPNSLEKLKSLKYLNFSFNQLSGEIPSGGPFSNFTAQAFLENRALCGRPDLGIPRCRTHNPHKPKTLVLLTYVLLVIASTMILIILAFMWTKYRKRNASISTSHAPLMEAEHKMISYHELCCATDDLCKSNLLGAGGFGSVYKGVLSDKTTVAVKVLDMQMEGACKSFDAECNVWRAIRHRNLVKVITTCSSSEVRALVLEYMPNGSLEKWLYSHNYCLTLVERVSILIDIASALEYLHHGQSEPVVHCDLKPSNVLLDEGMVAHVGDFGIAKILAKDKDATQTRTLGTIGYVAPEYGSAGKVSTKGDVYSFGIMLMEIMTRRNPTDEMFSGKLTLRQWIYASLPGNVMEVVDAGLLSLEEGIDIYSLKGIIQSIFEIGCKCSEELPENRMEIKEAVPKLMKLKRSLVDFKE